MFNNTLTGFDQNPISPQKNESEKISVLKELQEIYVRLKHMPGKHNQEDHAWNAGNEASTKKKRSKPSKRFGKSDKKSVGISSPFEASRAGAQQARQLGVKNVVGLTRAITAGSNALRAWSDKFRAAVSMGDEALKKQVVDGFKELSAYLTKLNDSLEGDVVAQNTYRAIIQSYQDTISSLSPESKKVFADYPLYAANTPDAKIANTVGAEIDKNAEK